jgi:hypothetical protein
MNPCLHGVVNYSPRANSASGAVAHFAAVLAVLASAACSGAPATMPNEEPISDPEQGFGGAALSQLPRSSALASCPASGNGAIVAPGPCFVFTPAQAGASTLGANANTNHYALEPTTANARGVLVVHLNGSLGSPAGQVATPNQNLYSALAADGFHVLGLSYRSTAIVGTLCRDDAACFEPTRRSLVLGTLEAGAPPALDDMRADEGIVARIDAAVRLIAGARRAGRWDQFIDTNGSEPATRVRWDRLIASGHSQGGGHAAFLGLLFPVRRVVQLSSTCDAVGATPAPWTAARSPWATSPATAFVGFAAPTSFSSSGVATGGDTICPAHLAVWQNMGLALSRQHDDASVCATGAHSATIACTANAARWARLYE